MTARGPPSSPSTSPRDAFDTERIVAHLAPRTLMVTYSVIARDSGTAPSAPSCQGVRRRQSRGVLEVIDNYGEISSGPAYDGTYDKTNLPDDFVP